ncbi:MAG: response regulator [Dehalococcoidia bacterium]|nr:response regulator [Dehalococcoidia bacterium]TES82126.1 MAG: response regulator [Dehalococcoidia bacterium]
MAEPEGSKKRILVIEDEPTIGLLCKRVLTASGFDVDVVNNGLDAKKVAEEKDYALCVSDVRLPGMTGIELYEHWKATKNPIAERVVFITGDTMSNYIRDFLKKAERSSVMKPFEPEDLVEAVRKALL